MNISKKLSVYLCSMFLCVSTLYTGQPTLSNQPAMPYQQTPGTMATTPESGAAMANEDQLLQQLDSVFDELTKGMSESEKNKFFNDLNGAMEEEIDKMSKMNDEELTKYIQDAEKELQNLGPWPEQTPATQPIEPVMTRPEPVKPVEPVVKEEPKKPSRDMVPTIDEIVARLDSFEQKANQIIDIAAKFEKWGKKGKLHGWNPTMTWAVFTEKVAGLKKTLLTIKSLDPKTQRPKYLVDLAANEPLCNNINQFKIVLAKHEPSVQAPSFGLKKLGKSSKAAIIAVINDCLEALLALNMQTELEKIIAKYEPTAKKLKEAEERAQQAAAEASKRRPVAPGAMKTTVKRGEEAGYYEFGMPSAKPGSPQYAPTTPYTPEKKFEPEETRKTGERSEEKGGAEKGGEKKKEEKPGPSTPKEDVKETETTKKVEGLLGEFGDNLDLAEDLIDAELRNVKSEVSSKKSDDLKRAATKLANFTISTKKAANSVTAARTRLGRVESTTIKAKRIKDFQDTWNQYRGKFMDYKKIADDLAVRSFPQDLKDEGDAVQAEAQRFSSAIIDLDKAVQSVGTGKTRH